MITKIVNYFSGHIISQVEENKKIYESVINRIRLLEDKFNQLEIEMKKEHKKEEKKHDMKRKDMNSCKGKKK